MAERSDSRTRRMRNWMGAHPRLLTGLAVAILAMTSLGAGVALGAWNYVCRDCPSIAEIYAWEPKQSTKIFDRDGELIDELFQERRTPIDIEDLPEHVPQAFIAIEDKRFYNHGALDLRGIARAAITGRGGGSTLTQQLARNMFEEQIGFERAYTRKLKEARVAMELEEVYSKDQILEAYMNQVNYDHGWRGIETASQNYFGKPATQIDPAEAALLAAIVNRPAFYNPLRNPDRARSRRNLVLSLMADQGYLTEADAEQWQQAPLPTERKGTVVGVNAPYFVEWVRDVLDDRFGPRLYSGGLRVHTTLDMDIQRIARAKMDEGWARLEAAGARGPKFETVMEDGGTDGSETQYIQGAFVALEPQTGAIRALIGGRDFGDSRFNRATQALRQPGSTFKPFVFLAALESGIPASHVMYDAPLMIDMPDGSTADIDRHRRERDAGENRLRRLQAMGGDELAQVLGAPLMHEQALVVEAANEIGEHRIELDGEQRRRLGHRRQDRTRRAAGTRSELDDRIGVGDTCHSHHPPFQEPRARNHRAHILGIAQETLQKGQAVILLRTQRFETKHRVISSGLHVSLRSAGGGDGPHPRAPDVLRRSTPSGAAMIATSAPRTAKMPAVTTPAHNSMRVST